MSRYLIIGGQPKAGTTSLYQWLAGHEDIVESRVKEARFFIDEDYPLKSSYIYNGQNIEKYETLFLSSSDADKKMRLEATPDYLYSENALNIAEALPEAKMIFIIRDPVERMKSWYKYAKQRGFLSEAESFHDFVMAQQKPPYTKKTPAYMRGLEQCRSDFYLSKFQERLGHDRCLIIDFADLKNNPQMVMNKVCDFAAISADYFNDFDFKAKNISQNARVNLIQKIYIKLRSSTTYFLKPQSNFLSVLKWINKPLKKLFLGKRSSNKSFDGKPVVIDSQTRDYILDYVNTQNTLVINSSYQ